MCKQELNRELPSEQGIVSREALALVQSRAPKYKLKDKEISMENKSLNEKLISFQCLKPNRISWLAKGVKPNIRTLKNKKPMRVFNCPKLKGGER